jgi:hypothetical protein
MRRHLLPLLGCCLALTIVLGNPGQWLCAADAQLAGNWKLVLQAPDREITLCLLELQEKDGKAQAKVLSSALRNFKDAQLEDVTIAADRTLHFRLKAGQLSMAVVAHSPKEEAKPQKLLGSVEISGEREFARLERTDAKEVDPAKAMTPNMTVKDLAPIFQNKDSKKKQAALQQFLEKETGGASLARRLIGELVRLMAVNGEPEGTVKAEAAKLLKPIAAYGPELERIVDQQIAQTLVDTAKFPSLALDYAHRAETLLDKATPESERLAVTRTLLEALLIPGSGAKEAAVKVQADKVLEQATSGNAQARLDTTLDVARQLIKSDQFAGLALTYSRQAEKLLAKTEGPAQQLKVLKVVHAALEKNNERDEAKAIGARINKMNDDLDQEFLKTAIPFTPEKFAGRKGDSERVVLLELFTGAQCPPCVAADVAFDGLIKTYKPSQVALLQYHLHVPGPDPLTNADSEARMEYYRIEGTPALFLDGKDGPQIGGRKQDAKAHYATLLQALARELETDPEAKLKLSAERKGDQVDIHVNVSDLKKPGGDVRLRLVLVEEVVRYAGRNGQRLHHHVVRSFPGGTQGLALNEKTAKHDVKLNVAELTKSLKTYLANADKNRKFLDDERPLDLKNLMIVAFIQNDSNKQVLEAAQIHLPEGTEVPQ